MRHRLVVLAGFLAAAVTACGGGAPQQGASDSTAAAGGSVQINGAGATFPNPIYSKWFAEYTKQHPDVRINYQPIGSGGGVRQLTAQTVFFGASDSPMTDEQLKGAPGPDPPLPHRARRRRPDLQPPGRQADLKFTGPLLADIYLGKIKKWNDPAIAKVNPGVEAAGDRHRGRAPLRWLGHDVHLRRLPVEGLAGLQDEGRRERLGQLAGRRRRQGQRRRRRPGLADAGRDRLRRADLRAAEQDQLRRGAERRGRIREGVARRGDQGRRRGRRFRPTSACRSPMRPAPAPTRSPRSPGSCSTRTPSDMAAVKADGRLHEVGADRRAEVRHRSRLRAAARRRSSAGDGRARDRSRSPDRIATCAANLGFRLAIGAVAVLLVVLVAAIGVELTRQSWLSIQKFGLHVLDDPHVGSGRR